MLSCLGSTGERPLAEVEVISHEHWAEVVLNRPQRRNAIDGPLGEHLAVAVERLDAAEDMQAILLRGADGAFCSGLDIKSFNADPPPTWLPHFNAIWRSAHKALYQCGKPIVAALERYAINGGAALALAADLLIAGKAAFLQVGEVKIGMAAPYNMAWLRLRHSESLVAKLTLTGRRFTGTELGELGIAYAVADDDAVLAEARRLTAELASYPAGAQRRIKATLRAYNDTPADAWFDRAAKESSTPRATLRKQVR